ncbi:MAG: glycosyltransferase [Synergistaceae bacterium]|nr:glycosyltransferase [Synergistaceae bacterium]
MPEFFFADIFLSVIIPTYKEAGRLPRTLNEILPYLRQNFDKFEILIVDDPANDNTADVTEALGISELKVIRQPFRMGKGAAVRRGLLAGQGDFLLFMDADHATPIEELGQMFHLLRTGNYTWASGVRTYQENEDYWRRLIGISLILLAHIIVFKKAVVDSQCGFKLFSRAACRELIPYCRVDGGMIDVEIFHLSHIRKQKCLYFPVHWENKDNSVISVWRCMLKDPLDMLKISLRSRFKIYSKPLPDIKQPWNKIAAQINDSSLAPGK